MLLVVLTPGGALTISGTIYYDRNDKGVSDSGESGVRGIQVRHGGGRGATTNAGVALVDHANTALVGEWLSRTSQPGIGTLPTDQPPSGLQEEQVTVCEDRAAVAGARTAHPHGRVEHTVIMPKINRYRASWPRSCPGAEFREEPF